MSDATAWLRRVVGLQTAPATVEHRAACGCVRFFEKGSGLPAHCSGHDRRIGWHPLNRLAG
jgi:hypothetical protein